MDLDTAKKRRRAAAAGFRIPVGPVPDGTIDKYDRAQIAGVYAVGEAAPVGTAPKRLTLRLADNFHLGL